MRVRSGEHSCGSPDCGQPISRPREGPPGARCPSRMTTQLGLIRGFLIQVRRFGHTRLSLPCVLADQIAVQNVGVQSVELSLVRSRLKQARARFDLLHVSSDLVLKFERPLLLRSITAPTAIRQ